MVLGALASVLSACAPAEVDAVASEGRALLSSDGHDLAWILDPVDMPPGHIGTSNCVYAFGGRGCNLGAHPDSGCWERDTGRTGRVVAVRQDRPERLRRLPGLARLRLTRVRDRLTEVRLSVRAHRALVPDTLLYRRPLW